MKNILLILVGGTICTGLNSDGTLSVSPDAGSVIKSNFEKSSSVYAGRVNIDLTENLGVLSENMTISKWNKIIKAYVTNFGKKKYDGVIFAHGTDTLAYSTALFSMLLSGTETPVFFVSSQKRLDHPQSNGNENFRCAVELIARGISPNVYVAYKNPSDDKMYLHLGSRLLQCANYSDDFYSHGMVDITNLNEENYKKYFGDLEKIYPRSEVKGGVRLSGDTELSDCVLMINPYPGIRYNAFDYSKFSAVLHSTYHSGTACCAGNDNTSVLSMIDRCADFGVDTYISPTSLNGEIYETVSTIGRSKIRFLYGFTTEMAYAKLVIAYSLFGEDKQRRDFIAQEWNFEISYKE